MSEDPSNYEDAPLEGIRRLMERFTGKSIPRGELLDTSMIESIRMGTTVATNALLERKVSGVFFCFLLGVSCDASYIRKVLILGSRERGLLWLSQKALKV